jgi:hypothetical protein
LNERPGETWWDDEDRPAHPDHISVRVYEANYAWYDAREAAAAAGIPFFGNHGEGGDYAGSSFASLSGEQTEVYTDRDGMMCLQIDEDMRLLTDLSHVRAYLEKRRAVEELFGIPAPNTGNRTIGVEEETTGPIGEYYLLRIAGDAGPDLHGPYPAKEVRDDAARRIQAGRGDEGGLFGLEVSAGGVPMVRPYCAAQLQIEEVKPGEGVAFAQEHNDQPGEKEEEARGTSSGR